MEEDPHSDRRWLSVRSGRKAPGREQGPRWIRSAGALAGAAPGTWRAGLAYVARYLGDIALAAEIVEGVADSAAKAHRHKPIKNPDSYLLSGIVRRAEEVSQVSVEKAPVSSLGPSGDGKPTPRVVR